MGKLRVGVVGCGEITSKATAPAFEEAKNVEIGMVMDVVEWAARDLGEKYNVPYTTSLDELLSNEKIDFVYIATPHYLHAPIAIKAARAGKHVLVEKPIAVNLKQADEMISECRKNGVKLSVCFPLRYKPQIQKAKELVDKGLLGDIIGMRIVNLMVKPASYWLGGYTGRIKSDWRTSKEKSGGGVLIMNSIHDIDYIRYITGLEAERVYSEYDTFLTPVEVEDFINVLIRYENGAIGLIEASSCIDKGPGPWEIYGDSIYGSKAQLVIPNPYGEPFLWIYTRKPTEYGEAGKWHKIPLESKYNALTRFVEEFAEAVLAGKEPPVTGEDGRRALEIVVAAYESGLKKAPVDLSNYR